MRLAEIQQALQARVLRGARTIEAAVPGTERFDTATRLGVYEYAYAARLTEALADTYPALRHALGPTEFAELIRAYATTSPPSHFSIRHYGRDLDDFVAGKYRGARAKVLSELARWEWLLAESFDAADAVALTRASLASIAPEQWETVCFKLSPAFRRMRMQSNAVQWWRAASERAPRPTRWRSAAPVEWAIWRANLTTYFRSLKPDEAWAIDAVAEGRSFAELCEGLVRFCDETQAPIRAATFLHRWLQDEWLVDLTMDSRVAE